MLSVHSPKPCPYQCHAPPLPGCGGLHGLGYPDNLIPVERQGRGGDQLGRAAQLPGTLAQTGQEGRGWGWKTGRHLETGAGVGNSWKNYHGPWGTLGPCCWGHSTYYSRRHNMGVECAQSPADQGMLGNAGPRGRPHTYCDLWDPLDSGNSNSRTGGLLSIVV